MKGNVDEFESQLSQPSPHAVLLAILLHAMTSNSYTRGQDQISMTQ